MFEIHNYELIKVKRMLKRFDVSELGKRNNGSFESDQAEKMGDGVEKSQPTNMRQNLE